MREAVPAGQAVPEIVPALMGMIKFGVSAFKEGRSIEGLIDQALQQLEQKAAQLAQNPQPTKEQQQAQAEMQQAQMQSQADAQVEQIKIQGQMQIEQMKMQQDQQILQLEQSHALQLAQMKLQAEQSFTKWEAELRASTQIEVALIGSGQPMSSNAIEANAAASANLAQVFRDGVSQLAQHISDSHMALANMHAAHMAQLGGVLSQINGPKRIVRGPDGRVVAVAPMPQPSTPTVQ